MIDTTYELVDRDLLFSEPQTGYVLRVRDMPGADRPREVFRPALERAAEVLGIELLDHLIITANRYASLMDYIKRAA